MDLQNSGSYLPRGRMLFKVSNAEQEVLQGHLSDYYLRRAGISLFTPILRAHIQLCPC